MRWPSSATTRRATAGFRATRRASRSAAARSSVGPAPAGLHDEHPKLDPRVYAHVTGHVTVPCYLNEPGCPPGSRFQYSNATSTRPDADPGQHDQRQLRVQHPDRRHHGQTFRPVLNGHGLFGTADQVNSDELYALGRSGLMACATDEIGMAQIGRPERDRRAAGPLELPVDPGPPGAGADRLPLPRP